MDKVTRFEIIDHTPCEECEGTGKVLVPTDSAAGQSTQFEKECIGCHGSGFKGRTVVFHNKNKQVDVQLQDKGRTLKVFITERTRNGEPALPS